MYWRVLAFIGAVSASSYAYRFTGKEDAAWAVFSIFTTVLLVLSEIERRLAEIRDAIKGV